MLNNGYSELAIAILIQFMRDIIHNDTEALEIYQDDIKLAYILFYLDMKMNIPTFKKSIQIMSQKPYKNWMKEVLQYNSEEYITRDT